MAEKLFDDDFYINQGRLAHDKVANPHCDEECSFAVKQVTDNLQMLGEEYNIIEGNVNIGDSKHTHFWVELEDCNKHNKCILDPTFGQFVDNKECVIHISKQSRRYKKYYNKMREIDRIYV